MVKIKGVVGVAAFVGVGMWLKSLVTPSPAGNVLTEWLIVMGLWLPFVAILAVVEFARTRYQSNAKRLNAIGLVVLKVLGVAIVAVLLMLRLGGSSDGVSDGEDSLFESARPDRSFR